MTKQEAIDDAVAFAERYNLEYQINDTQAVRIGYKLWENLSQARKDALQFNGRGLIDGKSDRLGDT